MLPRYLYHATSVCNRESIEERGLISSFGEVYASESEDDCLAFMGFRLLGHFHFVKESNDPVYVEHDSLLVYQIDTKETIESKWEVGTDHNAKFFGDATSWVYLGSIGREAIARCIEFSPQDSKK